MSTLKLESVRGELYQILHKAALSFVTSFDGLTETDKRKPLSELIEISRKDERKVLNEFAETLDLESGELFALVGKLDSFQLEQFLASMTYYRDSINNAARYESGERTDFFLSLTYHIIHDIQDYRDEFHDLIRKKIPVAQNQEQTKEVASDAASFSLYTIAT